MSDIYFGKNQLSDMEGRWVLPSQRQNLYGCESGLCPSTAAFICGCERKPLCHPASSFFFNSKWLLRCSINKQHVDPATDCHLMWLQTSPTESRKLTLLQLYDLNVLEEVGTHYRILGTFCSKTTLVIILFFACM